MTKSVHRAHREQPTPEITAPSSYELLNAFVFQLFQSLSALIKEERVSLLNLKRKRATNYLRIYIQGALVLKHLGFIFMYI